MKRKFLCTMLVLQFMFLIAATPARTEDRQYDINSIKGGFMLLYDSEWRLFNLNYRLFSIIDKEFDALKQSMAFGTSGFQLAINKDNIIEKIQSEIFTKFGPEYEKFLKSFQSKYYTLLQTNPSKYSVEKIKQAPQFEVIKELQHKQERDMLEHVSFMFDKRLNDRLSNPYLAFMWLGLGLSILIFRGFILRLFHIKAHFQRMRVILAIAGLVVLSFGTFQVSRGLFFTQGVLRDFMNEQTKLLYTSQLPNTYWNILESHVRGSMN